MKFYLKNIHQINNWDLVDLSSHEIVGGYLLNKNADILKKLAKSKNLWEKRIACISTFEFIRNNRLNVSLELAEMLLEDKHDLIHKAVGWMLREMGKRDPYLLRSFLKENAPQMPRTALRYSIEKLPESERKRWLAIKPSHQIDRRS